MTPAIRICAARLFTILSVLLLTTGCARTPDGVNSNGIGTQLIVTMTVAGQINPSDFYFVLFNLNNTSGTNGATGPIPVIGPPYYNGFAVGSFSHYLEYYGSQPNDGYVFYAIQPDLQTFTPLGAPLTHIAVQGGGNTLQFSIRLSDLATSAIPAASITSLQVNFLATNVIPPPSSNLVTSKNFDALGDPFAGGINNYITITNPTQSRIINNQSSVPPEASGDVATVGSLGTFSRVNDPDLDITNWSIEIRS